MADALPANYPELPCPVEGCGYDDSDQGCGLPKVGLSTERSIELWDEGNEVVRGCFAHRAAEAILAEMAEEGLI